MLIIKDNFSSFIPVIPCNAANAITAADALLKRFADFGIATARVSDREMHFQNSIIATLQRTLQAKHHSTLAYCPQSNGTVEVVCREVLRCIQAVMDEWRLPFNDWSSTAPVMQNVLNQAKPRRLGNGSPAIAFTALQHSSPLASITQSSNRGTETLTLSEIRARQLICLESTLDAINSMRRHVKSLSSRAREQRRKFHNQRTHIHSAEFTTGDYALCRKLIKTTRKAQIK